ncbi:hypothetical protein GJAV_G00203240 [Gymnothorax javanicus]|nr:hypothetical protein GJAV_G00203240 [Gymnothorax javanicus]
MSQSSRRWTNYDERFEFLYSSIVKENFSWSQTAMSLSNSVHHWQSESRRVLSGGFRAPVPERGGKGWRSREATSRHTQYISVQERSSPSWHWLDRDPGRYGRGGGRLQAQGQKRRRDWGGSENSIVISDEGTDWEILEDGDGGRKTSTPVEEGSSGISLLWTLGGTDELQGGEQKTHGGDHVVSLVEQDGLEFRCGAGEMDGCSDSSSTASGPTLSADLTGQLPCPACVRLIRKMRKLKNWRKSTEYDPMSLSCDQWVLKKIWRPRALPKRKGKLWTHLSRIRKRALSRTEDGEMPKLKTTCSRPHVFLHRNLVLCKRREAQNHRKPGCARRETDPRRRVIRAGARQDRRQKRKLCETEGPHWEGPLEEVQPHCTGSSISLDGRVALNVIKDNSSKDDSVHRKLESVRVSVPPLRKRPDETPQFQITTEQNTNRDTHCASLPSAAGERRKTLKPSSAGGALDPHPRLRFRSFRSMLSELERNRNIVVQELDRVSEYKL